MIESYLRTVVQQASGLNVVAPNIQLKDIKRPAISYSVRSLQQDKRPDKGIQRLYSLDYQIHCDSYAQAKQYQEKLLNFITYLDEYTEVNGQILHVVCTDVQVADMFQFDMNVITLICDFNVFEFEKQITP